MSKIFDPPRPPTDFGDSMDRHGHFHENIIKKILNENGFACEYKNTYKRSLPGQQGTNLRRLIWPGEKGSGTLSIIYPFDSPNDIRLVQTLSRYTYQRALSQVYFSLTEEIKRMFPKERIPEMLKVLEQVDLYFLIVVINDGGKYIEDGYSTDPLTIHVFRACDTTAADWGLTYRSLKTKELDRMRLRNMNRLLKTGLNPTHSNFKDKLYKGFNYGNK